MSEVKRYTMDHKGLPFLDEEGLYVLHEDFAALQQKLDAAQALADLAREMNTFVKEGFTEVMAQRDAAESECANLRQAIDDVLAQRDALASKGLELCREAWHVYEKYNATQMPDMDLVDGQTIQEFSDLAAQLRSQEAK